jgi:Flp pilus assembly protein TadG
MSTHHLPRSARGSALVELAVALPMLVALLVGVADFARAFYVGIELTNAARAGVQWGGQNLGNGTSSTAVTDMQNAATNAVNVSGLTFPAGGTTSVCSCADTSANLTTIACSADPVTACTGGSFRVITVTVTVSKSFTTISPYIPGIPRPMTLTRKATMRVTE